ncbi:MAG TPA: hypothetical protein VII12_07375 [Thermoanaerobaculia bacterium]
MDIRAPKDGTTFVSITESGFTGDGDELVSRASRLSSPDDKRMEPYWALAEVLDIPVSIHMGEGPPGAPIFYNNAAHFLRLSAEEIAKHHNM